MLNYTAYSQFWSVQGSKCLLVPPATLIRHVSAQYVATKWASTKLNNIETHVQQVDLVMRSGLQVCHWDILHDHVCINFILMDPIPPYRVDNMLVCLRQNYHQIELREFIFSTESFILMLLYLVSCYAHKLSSHFDECFYITRDVTPHFSFFTPTFGM